MTFKKFSIFLISFVFIFISIRFYSFVEDYSSWQYADWLINYQGGFVRRGLFGEIFFNIYKLFSLRLDLIVDDGDLTGPASSIYLYHPSGLKNLR